MKKILIIMWMWMVLSIITLGLIVFVNYIGAEQRRVWDFEETAVGKVPAGWMVEATNPRGELATWAIITDGSAPSGEKVLALTSPNHDSGDVFNICWTNSITFLNGEIEVQFKANSGAEDQGGGIIWRVQDRDNYYIARFNPLEENFRVYTVKNGVRKMLASTKITLPAKAWHKMKISHYGDKIEGSMNGKKQIELKNQTFNESGGIGLWTKADAATSFDDVVAAPRNF